MSNTTTLSSVYRTLNSAPDKIFDDKKEVPGGGVVQPASNSQPEKAGPKNVAEGLYEGVSVFGKGVFEGISGVIVQPYVGAKEGGATGFFKGVGKGLAGVPLKPMAGLVGFAAKTAEGVIATASDTSPQPGAGAATSMSPRASTGAGAALSASPPSSSSAVLRKTTTSTTSNPNLNSSTNPISPKPLVNHFFGVPLAQSIQFCHQTDQTHLFDKMIIFLEEDGVSVPNLFRTSPNIEYVFLMKDLYERAEGNYEFVLEEHSSPTEREEYIHRVAGLLRLYLSELPEPLFVYSNNPLLREAKQIRTPNERKNILKKLINSIQEPNSSILRALFGFLFLVTSSSHINKMSASRLTPVFAPLLIRAPSSTTTKQPNGSEEVTGIDQANVNSVVEHALQFAELIEMMISKYYDLFVEDE